MNDLADPQPGFLRLNRRIPDQPCLFGIGPRALTTGGRARDMAYFGSRVTCGSGGGRASSQTARPKRRQARVRMERRLSAGASSANTPKTNHTTSKSPRTIATMAMTPIHG